MQIFTRRLIIDENRWSTTTTVRYWDCFSSHRLAYPMLKSRSEYIGQSKVFIKSCCFWESFLLLQYFFSIHSALFLPYVHSLHSPFRICIFTKLWAINKILHSKAREDKNNITNKYKGNVIFQHLTREKCAVESYWKRFG